MKPGFEKYIPFQQIKLENRQWPNNVISKAPIWCSVDLRDGNQALVDPMNMEEKLEFFHTLVDMGFKEIEIGFPSASETEYEICRELIEGNHIPDDVTIQVLVQAREHLIRKTFEAVKGAKNVIIHFYNSTSTLQRKVVFKTDMEGVTKIAIEGAKLIKQLTDEYTGDTNFRFEYSPESFSGTEVENAVYICDKVMEALGSTKESPVILNLPNTVEMCTPNTYADQVEYFIKHIKNREACIISLHPHNDRGTGVASGELALLAGAEDAELEKVQKIASDVGIAFQIQDDILDVTSTTEELGKPVHSDEKNEKTTYVTLKGLEKATRDVEVISQEALELLSGLDRENAYLTQLIRELIHRKK